MINLFPVACVDWKQRKWKELSTVQKRLSSYQARNEFGATSRQSLKQPQKPRLCNMYATSWTCASWTCKNDMGMSENGVPQLVAVEEYHDKQLDVGLPVGHTTRFLHRKILRTLTLSDLSKIQSLDSDRNNFATKTLVYENPVPKNHEILVKTFYFWQQLVDRSTEPEPNFSCPQKKAVTLIELDDGKNLTGKPYIFDGKNPWVSGFQVFP